MNCYIDIQEERRLIFLSQNGDRDAEDALILAALPFVGRKLRCRFPSMTQNDLDDVMQDVYFLLKDAIPKFDLSLIPHTRLYNFTCRRIVGHVIDTYRAQSKTKLADDLDLPEPTIPFEDPVELNELRELSDRALLTLAPRERDVLWQRLATDVPTPRRILARVHGCAPQNIAIVERRAVDQYRDAFVRSVH